MALSRKHNERRYAGTTVLGSAVLLGTPLLPAIGAALIYAGITGGVDFGVKLLSGIGYEYLWEQTPWLTRYGRKPLQIKIATTPDATHQIKLNLNALTETLLQSPELNITETKTETIETLKKTIAEVLDAKCKKILVNGHESTPDLQTKNQKRKNGLPEVSRFHIGNGKKCEKDSKKSFPITAGDAIWIMSSPEVCKAIKSETGIKISPDLATHTREKIIKQRMQQNHTTAQL